ncbi:golgin subfamily A member 4-like isoform X2 [Octopus sinensis]|uniref:Golgin subfamily A member 4-like isoform X2 n=1 Tax=Octopus sinensis TaxID=2607531 RepID=A0A7E6F3E5_9MOLL|nr:golgin subfamily A member 4-like isoform X2 [Octopus sinensis]
MDGIAKEEVTVEESAEITSQLDEKSRHFNLLSSRLEEQSNLIRILKEQIHNTETKIANYEENNKNLDSYRNFALSELKEQMIRYKTLKDHYYTLQNNFLEIKALTEQYKSKNKLLADEIKTLELSNEKLFGTARCEILDQVESLKKTDSNFKEQCKLIEEKIAVQDSLAEKMGKDLEEDMKNQKKKHKEEMEKLMSKLEHIENVSQAERTLKLKPKCCPKLFLLNKEIEKLQKEKEQADDELAYKEKLLQFEQNENAKLIENISTLKKTIIQEETQFNEKVSQVQSDALVISLQKDIQDVQLNYKKTQREIAIYKEESRKKLEYERKLNEKLRHITG